MYHCAKIDWLNINVALCSATRGLLVTDHVILNHGQVTWTTPELDDVSALDRFSMHRCPTWRVHVGQPCPLVTRQAIVRYLDHSAIVAFKLIIALSRLVFFQF
ncbi:uncharacterized protein TNCV_3912251 [Trichonephila clavipes]|nr:uncharacterized protein TNCV_3912251 [Trichonephila clavipes]